MASFDLSILEKGGPIMWVLLLMSLISFIIFIERVLFLHRGQIRSSEFVTGIKNIVRKQRLVEALTLCEETPGPVPSLVKASLLHFGEKEEKIRYEIQEAALVEIPVLEKPRDVTHGGCSHCSRSLGCRHLSDTPLFGRLMARIFWRLMEAPTTCRRFSPPSSIFIPTWPG